MTISKLLGIFTFCVASFASAANLHPITQLPELSCEPATCYEEASKEIERTLLPFDPTRVAHPDLTGPSEFWGRSQYYLVGHRTPYVFVTMHGIFEDGRPLAPEALLATQYGMNVLHLVLGGHGVTNALAGQLIYSDWVQESERAIRLAQALGDHVILIGHSTGGMISVIAALTHPEVVSGLVLVEPAIRVRKTVRDLACLTKPFVSNAADFPWLLSWYERDLNMLHNKIISPSAGCEVPKLRKYLLSIEPNMPEGSESALSRELGRRLHMPLLMLNNLHDRTVSNASNKAFADGVRENSFSRYFPFNQDNTMRHGLINFMHPEMITSEMQSFFKEAFPDLH